MKLRNYPLFGSGSAGGGGGRGGGAGGNRIGGGNGGGRGRGGGGGGGGTGGGGAPDQYGANVVSLLRFNNAGTGNISDDVTGNVWSAAGGVLQTLGIEGAGSLDLNGNTVGAKYVSSTTAALMTGLNWGTGDFSIEISIKSAVVPPTFFTAIVATNLWALRFRNFAVEIEWNGLTFASGVLRDGNAHRLMLARSAGVLYAFADGTLLGSGSQAGSLSAPSVIYVGVADGAGTNPYDGFLDEMRITKGVARATASYVADPPGTSFPVIAGGGGGGGGTGALPNDIVDSSGAIVQSAYNSMAGAFASDSALIYRFGDPASNSDSPTLPDRSPIGTIDYGGGTIHQQHLGGPESQVNNDYVSSHGIGIVKATSSPTVLNSIFMGDTYGLDRHFISLCTQLRWQDYQLRSAQVADYITAGTLTTSNAADLPVVHYRLAGIPDSGGCRMGFFATNGSATKGAVVGAVGTHTAQNRATCTLPVNFTPTCMANTASGEFLFVAGWDTALFRGRVAVISLGGTPAAIDWQTNHTTPYYDWWYEFTDMVHPGLKSQGGWTFMKFLGFVDLPTNVKAPTCAWASTGVDPTGFFGASGITNVGAAASPLETHRANLLDNNDLGKHIAHGACLVVGSKSEKTLCFVDAGPLIAYTNDMYLGSAAKNLETQVYYVNGSGAPSAGQGADGQKYLNNSNGDVYLKTAGSWGSPIGNLGTHRGCGLASNQWPYLLSEVPAASPVIAKTVTLSDAPAGITGPAAYGYWDKDNTRRTPGDPNTPLADPHHPYAWVVTRGGTLTCWTLGRYVPGTKPADIAPSPSEIAQIGTPLTGLGTNITHVTACKDYPVDLQGVVYDSNDATPGSMNTQLFITNRAHRQGKIIQFGITEANQGNPFLRFTLEDSRMDPITMEMADPYYIRVGVIAVTDFAAGVIRNFRILPINYSPGQPNSGTNYPLLSANGEHILPTFPCGGKPFNYCTSNAP